MLTESIHYLTPEIEKLLATDFALIDDQSWYLVYQRTADRSFWRLDKPEKYQLQCLTKLTTISNWTEFDDQELRENLLSKTRGHNNEICIWKDCKKNRLNELVYCEVHAFREMGIRI